MGAKNKNLGYLSNIDGLPSRLFQSLIHGAWRFVVWSEDAVVGKVFCSGEAARLDQGLTPGGEAFTAPSSSVFSGRWRLLLLRRRRFSFREGEAYLASSSPSCLRRVEATIALRCRLGTHRKLGC
ncbi:unnamed protein product [Brassica napus]|uniref:(rape) hypothetical protein n=1 Tax=Brassica napus TaxID=3708 RepID=A0A816UW63_BRANA|nr:unnamed protein product [Brassica napus]